MTDMFDLMVGTLKLLGGLRSGTASAGTNATLTDTLLRLEDADYWNGGTIWITEAAGAAPEKEFSMITDFAAGVFTFNILTAAVAATDKYACSDAHFPFDQIMDAVNLAISQYRVPRSDTNLITVASTTQYTLPAAVQHGRLKEVYVATTTKAENKLYRKVGEWWTKEESNLQQLIVPEGLTASMTLRLDYELVHTDFDSGDDELYEFLEPKQIIYRAAEYMLLQQMYAGDEWPYLEERMNYFISKADAFEAEYYEKIGLHRRE